MNMHRAVLVRYIRGWLIAPVALTATLALILRAVLGLKFQCPSFDDKAHVLQTFADLVRFSWRGHRNDDRR